MRKFARRPDAAEIARIAEVTKQPEAIRPSGSPLEPAQDITASRTTYSIGQVAQVPVHELKINPLNARRVVSPAGLDELAQGMKERGQEVAALGYLDDQGTVCLIDGHRRLEACRIAEIPTLRVEIRPKPENEQALYLSSRAANIDREAQTPIDDALAWKMLLDRQIFPSQAELSRRLNVDPTVVNRILGLANLPKPLMAMLTERPALMNLRMLDAIKRFFDVAGEADTETLIVEVASKDLSSRDVDARRVAFQKGPSTRVRGNTQTLNFDRGTSTVKRFAGQGRLILEIKDVTDEKHIDQLQDELNKLVSRFLSEQD
ncbi:ParB/RepB/Spo0J family partition protein [Noviherbaspirillum sp. CPCC 100848]|uniref:ParB/RepB/Spo0J family partition protein n=1 Tax=Noviherbaspirillum album TaxID=3080276 RepID=A0ABU6J9P7_9BURK|nr:ParB/RepB/Spo0J family partition protein [Noviherbaspirillum sp. CPCC 100848]MEC4720376.1 ParB/RepB/Spo0J family partition protein [Noviherbaspirillum sp. CPCC 100848]